MSPAEALAESPVLLEHAPGASQATMATMPRGFIHVSYREKATRHNETYHRAV
jgi:hypothetical protein